MIRYATRFPISFQAILLLAAACFGVGAAQAQSDSSSAASPSTAQQIQELRQELHDALQKLGAVQHNLDSNNPDTSRADLQRQLDEERTHLASIETRLDQLAASGAAPAPGTLASSAPAAPAAPAAPPAPAAPSSVVTSLRPSDIYNGGFGVKSSDNSFSMTVNGLVQTRFTYFKPQANVIAAGASPSGDSNFDVYLGRLAFSGNVFDPSIHYFLQFQGSTAGNSNGVTMLDWFVAKTFSPQLTVQMGRSWTPYSFEYYMNPGNYLFPDLSTAEFAFVLPRAIGIQASGQQGRFSYAAMVGNSIPALDAPGQENFSNRLAYIGHFQIDLLAPFGYVETDPNPAGAQKPELSFWASAAYNPIQGPSGFENTVAGDRTDNATASLAYRYRFFSFIGTGYFRKTMPYSGLPADNSYGYSEQAGYYLIPGRFEIAERVSGVNWGADHYLAEDYDVNTWFAGPNFPYHRVTEHSLGLNYYLHSHNVKFQAAYSYLTGNQFSGQKFGGNRIWAQAQLMF